MFKRLQEEELPTTIFFDGQPVPCRPGDSVAAALLVAGIDRFRTTPVRDADRMPYCMIGNCFDCLVEIDSAPDRQACLVPATEGMQIRPQRIR